MSVTEIFTHPKNLDVHTKDVQGFSGGDVEKNKHSQQDIREVSPKVVEKLSKELHQINDVDMKKECIQHVVHFFGEGKDIDFAFAGLEDRCEICLRFYEKVKELMGLETTLNFSPMPPYKFGGYNPVSNVIELNASFLEEKDCKQLLNTILHESRHAFQKKCINNPESTTIKNNIIEVWKDNFKNYISPEFDFEAYVNQEVEKDANYYADTVMSHAQGRYA